MAIGRLVINDQRPIVVLATITYEFFYVLTLVAEAAKSAL